MWDSKDAGKKMPSQSISHLIEGSNCHKFSLQGSFIALKKIKRPLHSHKQVLSHTFLSPVCSPKNPFTFPKETSLFIPGKPFPAHLHPLRKAYNKSYILTTLSSYSSLRTPAYMWVAQVQTFFSCWFVLSLFNSQAPTTNPQKMESKFFLPYTALPFLFYHLFSTQQSC